MNFFFVEIFRFIQEEEGDGQITQHEIVNNVDVLSAQKFFELKLDKFGPYKLNYTRNGRLVYFIDFY